MIEKNEKISVIITSIKDRNVTRESLGVLPEECFEVIISKTIGLGKARNEGAKKAKGDVLVFFDDDLYIKPKIWEQIKKIKKGSFIMVFDGIAHGSTPEPFTRTLVIYKDDFLKVGGFDESIKFSGEDREFFLETIKKGLKPYSIKPETSYVHKDHPIRFKKSKYFAFMFMSEHAKVLVKHGAYTRFYKSFTRWFLPFLPSYYSEKKTLRLFGARTFYSLIRDGFVLYWILRKEINTL